VALDFPHDVTIDLTIGRDGEPSEHGADDGDVARE
jgi:hypothetical protein